jgi:excisionase family DNA binding protein
MLGPFLDALSPEAQAELWSMIDARVEEAVEAASSSSAPASPWLSVARAAERLNISEGAVRDAIKRKALPAHRVERRLLLRIEDVDALPRRGR